MNPYIFGLLLFSFQAVYWFIGRRGSRGVKTREDYFLAEKKVTFLPLMMTLLATQVGGGFFIGAAEEAYRFGWYVLFYPLGGGLGLILLGLGIGQRLSQMGVATVAEIFEKKYRSKVMRQMASALSIISLFLVLVAQMVASQKFLFALGLTNPYLFIVFWGAVIFYTSKGGLRAVIATDMVQAIVFAGILMGCFLLAICSEGPSVSSLSGFGSFDAVKPKLYGWLLMPLFFMLIEQDIAQRTFAGASKKIVARAAICAGLSLMVICFIPVFFGVLASSFGLNVVESESVLMTAISYFSGAWTAPLVGCAILAAIVSTVTSLINAISSNIAMDFSLRAFKGKENLPLARGITAGIAITALAVTFYSASVLDLLIMSYELSVCALLVPIVCALFKKKNNRVSAALAIVMGVTGYIVFRIVPPFLPKEILSIALSLCGFCTGELLSLRRKRRSLQKA